MFNVRLFVLMNVFVACLFGIVQTSTKYLRFWVLLHNFLKDGFWENAINGNVLNQAVFNQQFPRSVIYSLSRLEKYLKEVLEENEPPEMEMMYREFGRIYSRVKFADESSIKQITLQRFLQDTKTDLLKFSHVLGQQFFSYA